MQCEICGMNIKGIPQKITIDSSKLKVCSKCVKYGKLVEESLPVSKEIQLKLSKVKSSPGLYSKKKSDKLNTEDLVEDHHLLIINARKGYNLTQEQLALKIKEKVSLIKRIERNDIVPEDTVRKKIEKALNIKLTKRVDDLDWKNTGTKKDTTLEDIVTIKK